MGMSWPNCGHPSGNEWTLLLWLVCLIILGKAVSHPVELLNLFPFVAAIGEKVFLGDGVAVLQHKRGKNKKIGILCIF